MAINPDFLKNVIFSEKNPSSWFIHAEGFYTAGILLVEASTKPQESSQKYITLGQSFKKIYPYKVAIYLLSHAIELLLKSWVSCYNQIQDSLDAPENKLKNPSALSHNAINISDLLLEKKVISLTEDEYTTMKLVDEYLHWFGRYYCPSSEKNALSLMKKSFSEPDENGLIDFKFKIKFNETHKKLIALYQSLMPPIDKDIEASLQMQYMFHSYFIE